MILLAMSLTLSQAVSYALGHSPSVITQQAAVAKAQADYRRSYASEVPSLSGSLGNEMSKSENYQGAYSVIGAAQASMFSQNTAQIGSQFTWNGGLSDLQALAAREALEQQRAQLRKTENGIANDVTSAFNAFAGKENTVQLDQGDLQYQNVLVQIAQAKVRAGVAAGVDVLSADAQQEKSRYTLDAAKSDAQDAREALAQTIGAPLDTQFQLPQRLAQPPLPAQAIAQLVVLAQSNRPEVASAEQGVLIAQANRRAADTDLLPQIQAFASFGNQFSPTFFASEFSQIQTQNAYNAAHNLPLLPLPARGSPGFWNIGVNSTITLPFWDWGVRRANHRSLNEEIAAQQSDLDAAKTQVELDVRQSYRAAQTGLAQIASAQDETRYATEAARIAKLQYEHGIKTLTDVLAAQQQALTAQTDLFNARIAYLDAIVKLRVALGIYTPTSAVADL